VDQNELEYETKDDNKKKKIYYFILLTTLSSPRTNPPNKAIKSAALTSSCPYILGQSE
jgi:hypothetical protein